MRLVEDESLTHEGKKPKCRSLVSLEDRIDPATSQKKTLERGNVARNAPTKIVNTKRHKSVPVNGNDNNF